MQQTNSGLPASYRFSVIVPTYQRRTRAHLRQWRDAGRADVAFAVSQRLGGTNAY